jgi:FlaA1/EpsC-like NDP-sugar epimerase
MRTLPLVLLIKLPVFYWFGLLQGWWRYVGMNDLIDITWAAVTGTALLYLVLLLRSPGFPGSVLIVDMVLTLVTVGGARFAVRAYAERNARTRAGGKRIVVVGAGQAGIAIVRELRQDPDLDYNPVGFVDDDPTKTGIKIDGVKVLGTTEELGRIVAEHKVVSVLIAVASAKRPFVERIVDRCRACNVDFKILPAIAERLNGTPSFRQVRQVSVEDLLGREPVELQLQPIQERLQGKILLITGAGGSIGSELARQVAEFGPRKLVLFERSENDLFKLGNELEAKFPQLDVAQVVGDILDVGTLRDAFSLYRPHSVFHAAAYKHVPMMENNCFQAVVNNVFGTYNVALVTNQYEAENFVLISSDKAVNPTNIMGCTKRMAELILLGLPQHKTRFMAVRFGNVLGSNGSVVPIFQQQVAQGGPVTVTHPDAWRYFMTIPEAVQLVLQASSMGQGGEIFVLNMGEPVRILDLARNLILLSGLQPDRDIEIRFTGLRPGEKLVEELQLDTEGLKHTSHNQIRVLDAGRTHFSRVQEWLNELSAAVEAKNMHRLIQCLMEIVPEYSPSQQVLSRCHFDRHDQTLRYARERAELSIAAVETVAEQEAA